LAKALGVFLLAVTAVGVGSFVWLYVKYDRIVDQKIKGQIFATSAKIYAAPRVLRLGDTASPSEAALLLRKAGYADESSDADSRTGTYRMVSGGIEIKPGAESFHNSDTARITFKDGKVDEVHIQGSGQPLGGYELEPQLVTALFEGDSRSKRKVVQYQEIPKVMVDAVLAIEDRRFFKHGGINYFRLIEAFLINLKSGHDRQGGSTLTMQLARGFFLTPEKTFKRKFIEMLIATELEHKLSKQQIFELYANQVNLGQRGSYSIEGFAQAAQAYFGKDLQNITLPEAALLAGMIQSPSRLSPYRHPERALERRNLVLEAMADTDAITKEEAERAKATPLKLAPPNVEASDAPYFVDLVKDSLSTGPNGQARDLNEQAYRIYTTLDIDLQKAAAEAVEIGGKEIDEQVRRLRTVKKKVGNKVVTEVRPGPLPQVALVAIDPHSGEVRALVGGRNYGFSQLNHAVAKRPTGSAFKPFVYATAINTALDNPSNPITPATVVDDSPTTFTFGDQIYEPRNYKEEYHGPVRLGYALALSLNNATVRLAEMVGYDKVAKLAKDAGVGTVGATPSVALGSYESTPLNMAGAYTVFANGGLHIDPLMVRSLRAANGDVVQDFQPQRRQVLDPRVAYVMTDMLRGVMQFGTPANTVKAHGFIGEAAGKTGTSHDAWFAGYTGNLLTIVWVGYDDYSDLKLAGATSAAPIWAEFMKRAMKTPGYDNPHGFPVPPGVAMVTLDKVTNKLATASCPDDYYAAFIAGTEPKDTCDHAGGVVGFVEKILGLGQKPLPPGTVSNPEGQGTSNPTTDQASQSEEEKKKPGFWKRIFGGGGDKKPEQNPPAPR
jgi:penicillin-binding protein 1B